MPHTRVCSGKGSHRSFSGRPGVSDRCHGPSDAPSLRPPRACVFYSLALPSCALSSACSYAAPLPRPAPHCPGICSHGDGCCLRGAQSLRERPVRPPAAAQDRPRFENAFARSRPLLSPALPTPGRPPPDSAWPRTQGLADCTPNTLQAAAPLFHLLTMPSHGGSAKQLPGAPAHAPLAACVGAPHASPASAQHRHSSGSDATDIVSPSVGRSDAGRERTTPARCHNGLTTTKTAADRDAAGWAAAAPATGAPGGSGRGRPGASWTSSQGMCVG